MKRARHILATQTDALCAAIPAELARNQADTRVAEIFPLLDAFKYLEREAATILKPRRLGLKGRPFWLWGIWSEVLRVPMGRVLVIAPSNYPLFLPGVQVLQALVAGNAAIWKPGPAGRQIALLFADAMQRAGLPQGLLQVTGESVEAAQNAIAEGVDKVFFTGSAASGRALLHQLAETLTPCVAELSGCDAVFVLPSADLAQVVKGLAFGMRLNGSATCMAPRRVILVGADEGRGHLFVVSLLEALRTIDGIKVPHRTAKDLGKIVEDAIVSGARVHGELNVLQRPIVVTGATSSMRVAQADIFVPLLVVLEAADQGEALVVNDACPYALTAAIFGDEAAARAVAARVTAGTVIINDLIVPTADPRVPFGGRRNSGFGTTQGAEGLLEMTAPKTIAVRRGGGTRHFEATTKQHEPFLDGLLAAAHAATWKERLTGMKQAVIAARQLGSR